jgi:predicted RNase H-like HicB family nuclease
MLKIAYPAIFIAPDANCSSYSVLFPDLPGCISAGNSLEHAFLMAGEALELHLDGMAQDDEKRPAPSSLEQARRLFITDYEGSNDLIAAVQLVPAKVPGRTTRINVSLDQNLVEQIDAITDNRSAFLTIAARAELARRRTAA